MSPQTLINQEKNTCTPFKLGNTFLPAAPLLTVAPLAGGYYENYPTTAGGQYDYSLASYGQDRVGELFTFPMVITAFFSAVLGGLLAPLVVGVAARSAAECRIYRGKHLQFRLILLNGR